MREREGVDGCENEVARVLGASGYCVYVGWRWKKEGGRRRECHAGVRRNKARGTAMICSCKRYVCVAVDERYKKKRVGDSIRSDTTRRRNVGRGRGSRDVDEAWTGARCGGSIVLYVVPSIRIYCGAACLLLRYLLCERWLGATSRPCREFH